MVSPVGKAVIRCIVDGDAVQIDGEVMRPLSGVKSRGVACVVLSTLALAVPGLFAKPRAPLPPLPEVTDVLWRETFNEPYNLGWTDAQVCVGDYLYVESGLGYALDRSGVVTPLIVPGITFQGHTNVSTATGGHLRAWVTPCWSSSLAVGDGGGPGTDVPLFELDAVAGSSLQAVWTLQASADGTALVLIAQTDTGPIQRLQTPIA